MLPSCPQCQGQLELTCSPLSLELANNVSLYEVRALYRARVNCVDCAWVMEGRLVNPEVAGDTFIGGYFVADIGSGNFVAEPLAEET